MSDQPFSLSTEFKLNTAAGIKPVDEFNEAKALGVQTRPVILGQFLTCI